ncbi:unnamed protein product [Ectocarpus sp. 13 AM-2016]
MATIGMSQAAASATAFLLTDALVPVWEWNGVDVSATLLNISGSFLAGLANGGGMAPEDNKNSEVRAAISIMISGFLAVWTRYWCVFTRAAPRLFTPISFPESNVHTGIPCFVHLEDLSSFFSSITQLSLSFLGIRS